MWVREGCWSTPRHGVRAQMAPYSPRPTVCYGARPRTHPAHGSTSGITIILGIRIGYDLWVLPLALAGDGEPRLCRVSAMVLLLASVRTDPLGRLEAVVSDRGGLPYLDRLDSLVRRDPPGPEGQRTDCPPGHGRHFPDSASQTLAPGNSDLRELWSLPRTAAT